MSVSGTSRDCAHCQVFLASGEAHDYQGHYSLRLPLGDNSGTDLPIPDPYVVTPTYSRPMSSFSVPRQLITPNLEWRNINPLSITYAFPPRLRSRLTLPGRAVCRNPWACGDRDSHPVYRYSCQQQLLSYLHVCSRSRFIGLDNVPLPRHESSIRSIRSFGSILQPRYVFGAEPLDQ